MQNWLKKTDGMTLIELIVTLTLLGILAAIGTSMLLKQLPKYRLQDATRTLFSDIQTARLYAVRNGMACTLEQFPLSSDSYRLVQNGVVLKTVTLNSFAGVVFGSLNGTAPAPDSGTLAGDRLVVQASGLANSGSFFLKSSSNSAYGSEVEVSALGKPKIKTWNGSLYQ